jgi:hypothetical protein
MNECAMQVYVGALSMNRLKQTNGIICMKQKHKMLWGEQILHQFVFTSI